MFGVFDDFLLVFGGEIGAGGKVEDGDGEVETRGVVADEHVEGRGGVALLLKTMDFESLRVGIMGQDRAQGFGVAVEIGDNRFVGGEIRVKILRLQLVLSCTDRLIAESGNADEAQAQVGQLRLDNVARVEHFAAHDVASGGEDDVGFWVGGEAKDRGAAGLQLEAGVVDVDPAGFGVFGEGDEIDDVLGAGHKLPCGCGSDVVHGEKAVDEI